MHASFISALSLLLSGCAVVTASGTEESVLFSGKEAGAEKPQVVLKPHNDLPMSVEFSCPTKLATMMTSVVVPFPPLLPVGFVNEHVSYLRIKVPTDAEHAIAGIRIITPQGASIPLPESSKSRRVVTDGGTAEITYTLQKDCEAFDGGFIEVAGFSYKNRNYPASGARLQFDSRIRGLVGPGLV